MFFAIEIYRLSHWLVKYWERGALYLNSLNTIINGCDISPYATIGDGSYISHPVGLVIGPGVVIGKNCQLFGNSIYGIKKEGSPNIGDNCVIHGGCVLIGGITIGANSIIGAMSFINKNVPSDCVAYTPKIDLTIRNIKYSHEMGDTMGRKNNRNKKRNIVPKRNPRCSKCSKRMKKTSAGDKYICSNCRQIRIRKKL